MTERIDAPMILALKSKRRWLLVPGHHGTTLGCLRALDQILKRRRPRHILDVGTGTGVLAIAAARLLRQTVACGDIDLVAVDTARVNAQSNGARAFVRPVLAAGLRHPSLIGQYDLIFANILAKPLRLLAPAIAQAASFDAELVLSGLLGRDVAGVLAAYRAQNFSSLSAAILMAGRPCG